MRIPEIGGVGTQSARQLIGLRIARSAHTAGVEISCALCKIGGPCWIRTSDQRIKSPMLYQLS